MNYLPHAGSVSLSVRSTKFLDVVSLRIKTYWLAGEAQGILRLLFEVKLHVFIMGFFLNEALQ